MKRIKLCLGITLIIFIFACQNHKPEETNPAVESLIESVSVPEIEQTISDLVDFETRYPHQKQIEAADYLYKEMKKTVEDTEFHEYEYWGVKWKNVVGTIKGKRTPEDVVIVCAHFDTKSEKQLVYAPGADDNASGCAAVMELARIFSRHSFGKTVKFVFFSRESTGQNGSKAYVKSLDTEKENIVAVLNLDMIAYGSEDEDIDLVTRPDHEWLVKKINLLADAYGYNTKPVVKKACY